MGVSAGGNGGLIVIHAGSQKHFFANSQLVSNSGISDWQPPQTDKTAVV
jgi:hypothetical protein